MKLAVVIAFNRETGAPVVIGAPDSAPKAKAKFRETQLNPASALTYERLELWVRGQGGKPLTVKLRYPGSPVPATPEPEEPVEDQSDQSDQSDLADSKKLKPKK